MAHKGYRHPVQVVVSTDTMMTKNDLLDLLHKRNIAFTLIEHPAVFTVAEAEAVRGKLPGLLGKCLFLESLEGRLWLLALPADVRVNLKKLATVLECRRLSFASADKLSAYLGLYPGAVCPYGVFNDTAKRVTLIVEGSLLASDELLFFHPLENTASLGLKARDLLRVLEYAEHKPVIANEIS